MTTSRREFLQLLGFSVVALAVPPVPSWLVDRRDASFPEFGLRVRIPPAWRFIGGAELEQVRADAVLPGGEVAKARVIELAGHPLLVGAREEHPRPGPVVTVWRQAAEHGDHAAEDAREFRCVHESTYRAYGRYFADYQLEEGGTEISFAGRPASRVIVRYTDESLKTGRIPVRLESHLLRWQQSWLTFNFLDVEGDWSAVTRGDFAAIEHALELLPPAAAAAV